MWAIQILFLNNNNNNNNYKLAKKRCSATSELESGSAKARQAWPFDGMAWHGHDTCMHYAVYDEPRGPPPLGGLQ